RPGERRLSDRGGGSERHVPDHQAGGHGWGGQHRDGGRAAAVRGRRTGRVPDAGRDGGFHQRDIVGDGARRRDRVGRARETGDARRALVERFTKEFAPLVTSGPPGVTGYTTGRLPVREVFAYWPALLAKSAVEARVSILD